MDVKLAGAVLASAGTLALAAVAAAAPGNVVLWQGETSEGVTVKLKVADSGMPKAFKIAKTESDCTGGGTLNSAGVAYKDFDTSDPGHFRAKVKTMRDRGAFHYHVTARFHGRLDDEPHSWSGSYKLHIKVFKGSETVDHCYLETRWSVGTRIHRGPGA